MFREEHLDAIFSDIWFVSQSTAPSTK